MHTKAIKENSLEHGLSRILVEDGMFDNIPVQSLKVLRQPARLMFKVQKCTLNPLLCISTFRKLKTQQTMDTNIMPSPKENKVPTVDTTSLSCVIRSEVRQTPAILPYVVEVSLPRSRHASLHITQYFQSRFSLQIFPLVKSTADPLSPHLYYRPSL